MTLVAVWKAEGRLMAVADTRIARSAGNVLTEHGPKLLPITVVCRQPALGPEAEIDACVSRLRSRSEMDNVSRPSCVPRPIFRLECYCRPYHPVQIEICLR